MSISANAPFSSKGDIGFSEEGGESQFVVQAATASADHDSVRLRTSLLVLLAALTGCASTSRLPPQFQVGDVVIARHFNHYPQLNGTQVRVTGELKWRWIKGGNTLRCYAVQTADGQELAAQSFQLQSIATQRTL
jgi:hypothetical protein